MNIENLNSNKEQELKNSVLNNKKQLLKRQVLHTFYKEGEKTIAELSDITNNSVPTLTNLMNELGKKNWVKKTGIGESKGGGRRPAVFNLNPTKGYIVSIRLSRQNTRFNVFNLYNQPQGEVIEIPKGVDTSKNILEIVKKTVKNHLKKINITNNQIIGYGITIPGLINIHKGQNFSYPQFKDKPLNKLFSDLFASPAYVEHDTKAMALGELWFGLARNKKNVLYISIGSGIGLGQIINGKLYHGETGYAGEFGHIQMNTEGELCYCGRVGCLETMASGTAVIKKAKQNILEGKSTVINLLVKKDTEKIKLQTIINAAHQNDQMAIELFENAAEYLSKGIATLIHLFNPKLIIIGGEMANAKDFLIEPIKQKINKYTMPLLKQETEILLSTLRIKAGLMGMLPLVMAKKINNDFKIENYNS